MTNNIQGNSHKVMSWFLNKNSINQKEMAQYIYWCKGRKCNQEHSTEQDSFRFDGKNQKLSRKKQKLRVFSPTKWALQQMLKDLHCAGNTEKEKTYKK